MVFRYWGDAQADPNQFAVSVPGNLGIFHFVAVLTLGAYSVDHDAALAYAIVLYIVALVPKILAGAVLLACAPRELTAGLFARRQRRGDA